MSGQTHPSRMLAAFGHEAVRRNSESSIFEDRVASRKELGREVRDFIANLWPHDTRDAYERHMEAR